MHGVFVGRHDRQLDPKGRLALPAGFRQKFESEAFLSFGENGCVDAFTPEEHERMAQETMEKVRRREIDRNRLRALSANTFPVPIDAQGRILLADKLRTFAGLELNTRVVVIGAYDRVEIWNSDRFDAAEARGGEGLIDEIDEAETPETDESPKEG
jgi:MraZ protein